MIKNNKWILPEKGIFIAWKPDGCVFPLAYSNDSTGNKITGDGLADFVSAYQHNAATLFWRQDSWRIENSSALAEKNYIISTNYLYIFLIIFKNI